MCQNEFKFCTCDNITNAEITWKLQYRTKQPNWMNNILGSMIYPNSEGIGSITSDKIIEMLDNKMFDFKIEYEEGLEFSIFDMKHFKTSLFKFKSGKWVFFNDIEIGDRIEVIKKGLVC